MFFKALELSFRDLLSSFLLKDELHQLRKEGSYNASRIFFTLLRWRINLFVSLDVPKVAVANA
jgi:hypothetical protein